MEPLHTCSTIPFLNKCTDTNGDTIAPESQIQLPLICSTISIFTNLDLFRQGHQTPLYGLPMYRVSHFTALLHDEIFLRYWPF